MTGDDGGWFVGIDWASEKHDVCVLDQNGNVLGERTVQHSGDGLAELCDWILAMTDGDASAIHVSIEVPHGAVVETLLERGFSVYAVNPKQLDRFRDRFTVAGSKDDRRDARVLADSLRTDRRCFRRLEVQAPVVIELREWSRMTDDLQQERVRLGNRIRQQLRRYYPQMLEFGQDVAADWFLDLWELVPTPKRAARVREASIQKVLKRHRIRRFRAPDVHQTLRQKPVTVSPGTTEAASAHIAAVAARVRLINRQLKEAHRKLDRLCSELAGGQGDTPGKQNEPRDVDILRSLPGVGRIVLATLLAEASQPLADRDYHALRALAGAAPVTRRSGKRCTVVMRKACHPRLRDAIYHWARVATQHDPRTRTKYAELRARGHTHGRALRSVADRLLAVACAMLKSRALFDPTRYECAA